MKFSNYRCDNNGTVYDIRTGKPIKTFKSNKYIQCCIFDDDGNKHTYGAHQVVAMLTNPNWFPGCVVHHIDGKYTNNDPNNLECMSRSKHSRDHSIERNSVNNLKNYMEKNGGPWNKGKTNCYSDDYKKNLSDRRKELGFVGNQYYKRGMIYL